MPTTPVRPSSSSAEVLAHRTRSQDRPRVANAVRQTPAQLSPPRKRKKKGEVQIPDMTDDEVWNMEDGVILGTLFSAMG